MRACNFAPAQVWRPGIDPIEEDEELEYDPTAYDCLHRFQVDWPCLRYLRIRRAQSCINALSTPLRGRISGCPTVVLHSFTTPPQFTPWREAADP